VKRLLQLSGVIVDFIYQVDKVPLPGDEAIVGGFEMSPGGGFNAMLAARRSNMHTTYAGGLGQGPLADMVRTQLDKENIPIVQHSQPARDQGCCTVLVDASGERTFIASEGAEGWVSQKQLAAINPEKFDWVLISGYPLVYTNSQDAVADRIDQLPASCKLVFDPCPLVSSIPESILHKIMARCCWISCNKIEASYLTGANDPTTAAIKLANPLPDVGGAVVRQGESGCTLVSGNKKPITLPGYPVNAIDTNGAGDSHVGTFIASLASGATPQIACKLANAAAALSTTFRGPATTPRLNEVQSFISRFNSHYDGESTNAR